LQDSQKNFHKKLLGRIGEKSAVKFLKKLKYKILETNYTNHVGEIDIIAKDNETIVFIEVKTRSSTAFGMPSEAVNYEKQRKYFMIASYYLEKFNYTDNECRFDVIEVLDGDINHIKGAFSK